MRRRTFITALVASSAAPSFATCASSQRSRKKPIKITLLGTGTPAPVVKEVHAGDVVEADGWKVTVGRASSKDPASRALVCKSLARLRKNSVFRLERNVIACPVGHPRKEDQK